MPPSSSAKCLHKFYLDHMKKRKKKKRKEKLALSPVTCNLGLFGRHLSKCKTFMGDAESQQQHMERVEQWRGDLFTAQAPRHSTEISIRRIIIHRNLAMFIQKKGLMQTDFCDGFPPNRSSPVIIISWHLFPLQFTNKSVWASGNIGYDFVRKDACAVWKMTKADK